MSLSKEFPLICPLDGTPLARHERSWQCEQGHSFDIAKQGYVNLLPVQHKRSRDPGDSKEMIAARRAFLGAGVYAPIAQSLVETVRPLLAGAGEKEPEKVARVLDAGCGEGYYLEQLAAGLASGNMPDVALAGLDISKWAAMAAARRVPEATCMVASNKNIPVADSSLDLLLCCFGFSHYPSFARVLKPGGKLLLVEAGPDHLIELRRLIYSDVKPATEVPFVEAEASGFTITDSSSRTFQTAPLDTEMLQHLLTMTPHLYRASAEGKRAVAGLTSLALTVDVVFRVLTLAPKQ